MFIGGALFALGAAGCFTGGEEETEASPGKIDQGGDTSMVMRSVLLLEGGCAATKVGPKHLLVSARCIADNEAYEAGKVVAFQAASAGKSNLPDDGALNPQFADNEPSADAGSDSGATAEGGAPAADAGSPEDAGSTSRPTGARTFTIASREIPQSFVDKCSEGECGIGALAASDAPDVALLVAEEEIETVPTLPVDLDPVSPADSVLALGSGCDLITEERGESNLHSTRTKAAPSKVVNHAGSAYKSEPQLVGQLNGAYVVTPGIAWREKEPKVCKEDFGTPLFRGGQAAVVGVLSNATTYPGEESPVTLHYTRLDGTSRFKIGNWLRGLGVETIRSCSEAAGGCVKREWTGGMPPSPSTPPPSAGPSPDEDGGTVVIPPEDGGAVEDPTDPPLPPGPTEEQLGPDPDEDYYYGEDEDPDYSDAAVPRKKKKKDQGGCSAAPGRASGDGLAIGLGLALAIAATRRRRRD